MDAITDELFDLIKIYNVPCIEDEKKNNDAKNALFKFRGKLKTVKPETCYNHDKDSLFYLHFLLTLRQALIDGRYIYACNELGSLIYRYSVNEERMKKIILETLERYL